MIAPITGQTSPLVSGSMSVRLDAIVTACTDRGILSKAEVRLQKFLEQFGRNVDV